MNVATTLGVYAGALALVFGAAVGVGNAVGPVGTAAPDEGMDMSRGGGMDMSGASAEPGDLPPEGLAVSQDGYALQLARTVQTAGTPGRLQFAIAGPDGERVTEFTPAHGQDLHLTVVRRDMTGFQHLHPARDEQGRWSVPLTLAQPGPYKVFADVVPAGRDTSLVLAADLTAPGAYVPQVATAPTRTASVDGYDVRLTGELTAGTVSRLTLTATGDGLPVPALPTGDEHLVALRDGDLAYVDVHPEDPGGEPGPERTFSAAVPSAATYRLFLDLSRQGVHRTAVLTATAAPTR